MNEMRSRMVVSWALAVTMAIGASGVVGHAARRPATQLQNTAPSMNALIARFLTALSAKDRKALQRLRVTDREYIDVIMPGSIEPERERHRFAEEKARY